MRNIPRRPTEVEILAKRVMEEYIKEPVMNGEQAHEIIDQAFAR